MFPDPHHPVDRAPRCNRGAHPRSVVWRSLGLTSTVWLVGSFPVTAQSIIPAPDRTNTRIERRGNRIDIRGGQLAGDRKNLFHSFTRFGLSSQEVANFLAQPGLQNILGRITGGEPSQINGLIQVSGGTPNLLLMNPAGIVFGPTARLNVPAAFTATTATGIGFGSQWFDAIGPANNYRKLQGSPTALRSPLPQPGAIVNLGQLAVAPGQTLALMAGTVLSSGTLAAPDGQILVAAVPGHSLIRLSQAGNPLSLEVQPIAPTPLSPAFPIATLPQLLTGGNLNSATGVIVRPDGTVQLSGSGTAVLAGAAAVRSLTARTALLSSDRTLSLVESQLQTTGDLTLYAGQQVIVRDSLTTPIEIRSGGDLTIQGNQGIDILALNHRQIMPIQSGGNLRLISDGTISGDAHFSSGQNFSVQTRSGDRANLFSLYDPIINVAGDFSLGNYAGASLQATAGGNITYGTVVINDIDPLISPNPAFFLTAGGNILVTGSVSTTVETGNLDVNLRSGGDLTVGVIATQGGAITLTSDSNLTATNLNTSNRFGNGGDVRLTATGRLTTGAITTAGTSVEFAANGGNVTLNAGRNIRTAAIVATGSELGGSGGNVLLQTESQITTSEITTATRVLPTTGGEAAIGGSVSLLAGEAIGSTIQFDRIDTSATSTAGARAGAIVIRARGQVQGTGTGTTIDTSAAGETAVPGPISIQHDGGTDNLSFTIGSATPNGTAGSITNGQFTLSNESFPVLPNGGAAVGAPIGLALTSINRPPTIAPIPTLTAAKDTQILIPPSQIFSRIADVDRDTTRVFISRIASGVSLSVDGSLATVDTEILPTSQITVTPPAGFEGRLSAFSIVARDRAGNSSPQAIGLTIPETPTLPPLSPCGLIPCTPPAPPFPTPLSPLPPNTEPQAVAQRIERDAGVKPAFIYVNFVPVNRTNLTRQPWEIGEPSPGEADDQLELVVVTAKGAPIRKRIAAATRDRVIAVARTLRLEVSDPRKTRGTSYLASAQQLYRWLIAPLSSELQARKVDNLVFLMDTGLRSLPIAALHSGQQFLIEQYTVGLMPSLSLTDTRYQDIRTMQAIGLGISESTQGQPPLPAVPVELAAINQFWSGRADLNQTVTLDTLKTLRQQQPFGIIHLATHANFEPGSIANSYIQLWNEKLRLSQLRDLGWSNPPVELLVLSACTTAVGDRDTELGFAGFAVQTGVKSVLASLWYVSDAATAALMSKFYQDLRNPQAAKIKAEALRQAQLSFLNRQVAVEGDRIRGTALQTSFALPANSASIPDRELAHPYYWSAFTLVGNPW